MNVKNKNKNIKAQDSKTDESLNTDKTLQYREELDNLLTNTRNSKADFESDCNTLTNYLSDLDSRSPIVASVKSYVLKQISNETPLKKYEDAIKAIIAARPSGDIYERYYAIGRLCHSKLHIIRFRQGKSIRKIT